MQVHPIYTEDNNCQDCYKCLRECPVKAIRIVNHSASIISDRCIYCGHCTAICPANAKKVREDVKTVQYFIEQQQTVIASLAPSYISEFSDWGKEKLIAALKKLGFSHISETGLGAEMVSNAVSEYIQYKNQGIHISSCCPSVVDLIHKYYPDKSGLITPITTPMLAHGAFLKEQANTDVKVVFIGPCIAKKKEAEKNQGAIDAVITFKKLREWLDQKGISPDSVTTEANSDFFPYPAKNGGIYPIDGGMLTTLNKKDVTSENYMCFSGLDEVIDILENIDSLSADQNLFLELMACTGGCINGPATSCMNNTALKRLNIIKDCQSRDHQKEQVSTLSNALENNFTYTTKTEFKPHKEQHLKESLQAVGKYSQKDELNCSGCGYESCRDFAAAMLDNIAEPTMCVSYMRQTAQRQASVLMQRMPYAVVLINDDLSILESNKAFAHLLGPDVELAFEHQPGLAGYDLKKVFPAHTHFSNVLKTGSETIEKDIRLEQQNIHLSIFTIQKHKIVCGIMHAFNTPEILKTEIEKRSKKVIKQNLKTVQKIALLLGENASETEAILNSLVNLNEQDERN